MIKRFALNHDKSLQIYFLCGKRQAKKKKKKKQKKHYLKRCRKHSSRGFYKLLVWINTVDWLANGEDLNGCHIY